MIQTNDLGFKYRGSDAWIFRHLHMQIETGEFVAIQGRSGSGKSTLFYLLGLLDQPSEGSLQIKDVDVGVLDEDQRAMFRRNNIGFVFQQFHLLPRLSVMENILLGTRYPLEWHRPKTVFEADKERAEALAVRFGLQDLLKREPHALSGGQQQRVAIARALVHAPALLLADEPTGNLDPANAAIILDTFKSLHEEGQTIVLITHDQEVAQAAQKTWVFGQESSRASVPLAPSRPTTEPKLPSMPRPRALLQEAWSAALRSKSKTLLTMLGVAVGVASILGMVTVGEFTKTKILASYEKLGTNKILFRGWPNWNLMAKDLGQGLHFDGFIPERDVEPLAGYFPEIARISPVLHSYQTRVEFAGKEVLNGPHVMGVKPDYFVMTDRDVVLGRNMNQADVQAAMPVCVIGYGYVSQLFTRIRPLGSLLSVTNGSGTRFSCKVVGVLESVQTSNDVYPTDLNILIPFTFFQQVFHGQWSANVHEIIIQAVPGADTEDLGLKLKAFFKNRYGKSGIFAENQDSKLIAQMKRFLSIFTLLLGFIASLSLFVGGIGVYNMLLVSIQERIREFGLKRALGATQTGIRWQVLTESLILSIAAGCAGLGLGFLFYEGLIFLGSTVIPNFAFEWVVEPLAMLLSFVSMLLVGVLSGLMPAFKAERFSVVEALRRD